jgi:signal transduction histidine kinase
MQERARRHGGEVVVTSDPGRGTAVCLSLPVAADVAARPAGSR